ncbi:MAG TPA: 30S ribosomal protein S12 methylthiotransferase RimO, partial [Geobacterales bacterium]|nr:30S ribosomal protein S12 methylthiotransferase RimO [Geobacterales bacterium]
MEDAVKEKVSLVSLGCPKNLVDAEVMLGLLSRDGYEVTTDERQADIIIVNTCSFIRDAKEESVETILELADRKQDGRCRLLIVTGCLPQRYQEELQRELPEVDIFIGTGDYPRIVEIIAEKERVEGPLLYTGDPNYLLDADLPRLTSSPRYSSYLKIAEGCSNCCSYCIIPTLRGSFRSRPFAQVIAEARQLADDGVRELNVIAQDITAYGRDLPPGEQLEDLLAELCRIEKLHWVRLLYAYPDGISERLVTMLRHEPKLCKYLDIPIQHISEPILKRMGRRSSEAQIRELIGRLRREIPEIALRTSLIVGFPGETDEDFRTLLR